MKFIIISKKHAKGQKPKDVFAELKQANPTPQDLINNNDDAIVFEGEGMNDIATQINFTNGSDYYHYIISTDNDFKSYESAWSVPKNKLNEFKMGFDLMPSKLSKLESLVTKQQEKQNNKMDINFVFCHFDDVLFIPVRQNFLEMESRPSVNIDRGDANFEINLKVDQYKDTGFYGPLTNVLVVACDCSDQWALERVKKIHKDNPDIKMILSPITGDPKNRKVTVGQIKEFAESIGAQCVTDFHKNVNWQEQLGKVSDSLRQQWGVASSRPVQSQSSVQQASENKNNDNLDVIRREIQDVLTNYGAARGNKKYTGSVFGKTADQKHTAIDHMKKLMDGEGNVNKKDLASLRQGKLGTSLRDKTKELAVKYNMPEIATVTGLVSLFEAMNKDSENKNKF